VFTRRSGRGGEGRNLIASYSSSQSQQKVRGGRGEGRGDNRVLAISL
jgi:hypothetical protein